MRYLWLARLRRVAQWLMPWSLLSRLRRKRVPVLLQLSAVECGAACLAMILSYFGRLTRVAECREFFGIGRDGLTAQAIARAARSFGLRVKAYSVEPQVFSHLLLPAIAHWDFNHFVVVEHWSPKWIDIVDPASGRRRLSAGEFDKGFTGVVLTFEPGVQFARRSAKRPSWPQYLLDLLRIRDARRVLAQILAASLFLQLLGLVLPAVTQIIVDRLLPYRIGDLLLVLGLSLLILVLAQMITSLLRSVLLIYLRARLDVHLMLGFFEHVLSLPFRFFQQRSSGDLLMRLSSNSLIRETLTSQTLSIVLDGTFVLGYLALLCASAPLFGLFVFAIGLLQVALLLSTTRSIKTLVDRDLAAQAESQSYLVEALGGIAALKASGGEDRALDHWSDLFFKQLNVSLQRSQLSAVIDMLMSGLRTFSPLALLWLGAVHVLNGSLSLGAMLALNALAASFLTPLTSLVSTGQQLQLVGAHLERIADVIEAEPEQDSLRVQLAPRLSGHISLHEVAFQYDPGAPVVLRDVALTIQPGQKVALVGRTGSGKSTLAMLLLGLYTPTQGEILYDGIPLSQLNYRSLRSQFGVVLQDPLLFSGSIRENIAFNDPHISFEQIVQAAQLAALDDDILRMPMAYETRIAEGGSALSGGQRQRIAIARALAHNPALLVLDEATSHLDVLTERRVDHNLSQLSCTRIVIAHRLSTIRNADVILVLNEGRIIERGAHTDLLALKGHYNELVQNQLENDVIEPVAARV